MTIPFFDFGRSGPPLIFLHANGYPPACYQQLLTKLAKQYHVSAMLQRPLWESSNPDEINDWNPLTDDFLRFLDENSSEPSIVVGHSMGGIVALRAALHYPKRFRALVLIDPVLFTPWAIIRWNIVRALGLGHRFHWLIPAAKARRRTFDNLDRLFNGYRRKEVFKYLNDESLRAYITGITTPEATGGYRLSYSPEWEIRIYYTGIWHDLELWKGLRSLKTPLLIIRGAETDTFVEAASQRVIRTNPAVRVETIQKSTHLVPLERPVETFELIQTFLAQTAISPIIRSTPANNGFHKENP
jgi:pimeloyl-ACP methyl ester carboxylesterase